MSVSNVLRRGLASAAVSATALALLAGAVIASPGLPSAQASAAPPRAATPASLQANPISLTGTVTAISEAPDGAVYYSAGSAVYVVNDTHAATPLLLFHASGRVLAVAANSADVFVDVKKTVTEYKRANNAKVRQWTLTQRHGPTSAGLYVVGSRVWAWTDWSTDQTGLEYGNVYRFTTSSATVHRVSSNNAFPYDAAADSTGFYYEAIRSNGTTGYLVRVTPSGTVLKVTDTHLSGPLALAGGRLDLLAQRYNSHAGLYFDSYRESTLAHVYSRRVSPRYFEIAGTGTRLLAVGTLGKVSELSPTTGTVLASVPAPGVPGASLALAGPAPAVLAVNGGVYSLDRITG
jgi:hypothetical protein